MVAAAEELPIAFAVAADEQNGHASRPDLVTNENPEVLGLLEAKRRHAPSIHLLRSVDDVASYP
jgi:hypothetical protein